MTLDGDSGRHPGYFRDRSPARLAPTAGDENISGHCTRARTDAEWLSDRVKGGYCLAHYPEGQIAPAPRPGIAVCRSRRVRRSARGSVSVYSSCGAAIVLDHHAGAEPWK